MDKNYDFSKNFLQKPENVKALIKSLERMVVKYATVVGLFSVKGGPMNINGKTVTDLAFNGELRKFIDTSDDVIRCLYDPTIFADEEGKPMSMHRIMQQADMVDDPALADFEAELARLKKDAKALGIADTSRERDVEVLEAICTYPMVLALTLVRVLRSAGNYA